MPPYGLQSDLQRRSLIAGGREVRSSSGLPCVPRRHEVLHVLSAQDERLRRVRGTTGLLSRSRPFMDRAADFEELPQRVLPTGQLRHAHILREGSLHISIMLFAKMFFISTVSLEFSYLN